MSDFASTITADYGRWVQTAEQLIKAASKPGATQSEIDEAMTADLNIRSRRHRILDMGIMVPPLPPTFAAFAQVENSAVAIESQALDPTPAKPAAVAAPAAVAPPPVVAPAPPPTAETAESVAQRILASDAPSSIPINRVASRSSIMSNLEDHAAAAATRQAECMRINGLRQLAAGYGTADSRDLTTAIDDGVTVEAFALAEADRAIERRAAEAVAQRIVAS